MEFFGFVIAVLTALLGFITYRNGKWMKQTHTDTLTLLAKMNEQLIKMDEHLKKMDENMQKNEERAEQRHKETLEILREIAHLIHGEGEKTRNMLKK